MKTYNFKPNATKSHINRHKKVLQAGIQYYKNRGIDNSKIQNELDQLNKFYKLTKNKQNG